ncbi:DUF4321 domain-containing protein [Caproiciproducens sp. NJN-50]|uniref:DUF4321 domain-containing protein n=1 Tax=Acutalibacteraceae TaxID=3082771 RepID=UPI000FFE1BFF|nr:MULTISPECIES: DUF4321 domain-containing protein [Acutalibacteraceae]QAT48390.1 DUF4321 domain-containing protein [Caproiciproducens sp. NJN-50]
MKKGILKTLLLIVLLVLAVVLGKAVSDAAAGVRFLSFLSAGASFGISTVNVDLSILRFTFGMTVDLHVAQALLLIAAILGYNRIH